MELVIEDMLGFSNGQVIHGLKKVKTLMGLQQIKKLELIYLLVMMVILLQQQERVLLKSIPIMEVPGYKKELL